MAAASDEHGVGPDLPGNGLKTTTTHTVGSTDGVSLALHDLGGEGPLLLMCHPTGFHGRVWAPVAAELTGSFHAWAVDFRGHGDSSVPAGGSLAWDGMADDVVAATTFVDQRGTSANVGDNGGGRRVVGVGHSMGGAALLAAEARRPGTFAALWLFEPIVHPAIDRSVLPENPMAEAARRRRPTFDSREAALAHYSAKPPLGGLHPASLEAYVQHGFADLPDGRVGLKCLPEIEARVFDGGINNGVFDRLGQVKCPVTIAASGDGGYPAQGAALVADTLPDGRLERFEDLTHFGPMEQPQTVAKAIHGALG